MDANKMNIFYAELEKLATYNNESITEEDFIKNLLELKEDLSNEKIPEIFELVRTKQDFRSKMQKYGGYQERREKLRENLYPIIERYEKEILNKEQGNVILSHKELNEYIRTNEMLLKTKYGVISIASLECKQGGNGVVFFGEMSDVEVAVKFLIKNTRDKLNRFLCEYGNVILKLGEHEGIVRMFFYDEIVINNHAYPMICMKKYASKLCYNETISEDEIINIVKQILLATKKVHDAGIVHRDLKPDNILIDNNGKINIADFGIAYYNPETFDKTGHTTEGERLGNYDFSAPEQRNSKTDPAETMDIYAIGQIIQWLVFGTTTRGTHRKRLYQKFNTPRMHFLDDIIDKCLNDDPRERYQKIDAILDEIEKYNSDKNDKKLSNVKINIESKENKEDIKELKEALKDIMNKICYSEYGQYNEEREKNFCLYMQLSNLDVLTFLETIPFNLEKLEFFDKVGFSQFVHEYNVYDIVQLEKNYFQILNELYEKIKQKNPDSQQAFVEYVKTRLNENFELPF